MHALTSRRSVKFLRAPAPKQDELEQILQAAMSAPDHGALRPWRFVLIRGEAIGKLADVAIGAVKRSGDPRMTPEKEKSVREWMAAVPLFIAVAQKIAHDNTKIPEQEQLLATGAAAMNLLNAVHMLGYGAFWSTGMGTYVEDAERAGPGLAGLPFPGLPGGGHAGLRGAAGDASGLPRVRHGVERSV